MVLVSSARTSAVSTKSTALEPKAMASSNRSSELSRGRSLRLTCDTISSRRSVICPNVVYPDVSIRRAMACYASSAVWSDSGSDSSPVRGFGFGLRLARSFGFGLRLVRSFGFGLRLCLGLARGFGRILYLVGACVPYHVGTGLDIGSNAAKQAVYKARGLVGAVGLCKLNRLVNGNGNGDLVDRQHLVQREPQEVAINRRHAANRPVGRSPRDNGIQIVTHAVCTQGEPLAVFIERPLA